MQGWNGDGKKTGDRMVVTRMGGETGWGYVGMETSL